MVGRRIAACAAVMICAGIASVRAETAVNTEMTVLAISERTDDGGAGLYNLAKAAVSLDSEGSSEVKGQLSIALTIADTLVFDIEKAYVKARLAAFRLTMGKTRLSWGEGKMYNSGDVLFAAGNSDLQAEDLRNDTAWLAAGYLPLGDFSFVEAVGMLDDFPLSRFALSAANPSIPAPVLPGIGESAAGIRFYAKVFDMKMEAGYLYDGGPGRHRPYASVQGNFLADLYLSSSVSADKDDPFTADTRESWEISGGLLYQIPVSVDSGSEETPSSFTVNLRLEGLLIPYGKWEAEDIPDMPYNPADSSVGASPYALSVYPELSVKTDTVFAYSRCVVSPVDRSALFGTGFHWSPLQGFTVLLGVQAQVGETGDVYGWERAKGWTCTVGTKARY